LSIVFSQSSHTTKFVVFVVVVVDNPITDSFDMVVLEIIPDISSTVECSKPPDDGIVDASTGDTSPLTMAGDLQVGTGELHLFALHVNLDAPSITYPSTQLNVTTPPLYLRSTDGTSNGLTESLWHPGPT